MKKCWLAALLMLICLALPLCARAGWNGMTVATEGEGIAVYATAAERKPIGLLYNGYDTSLSLDDTRGMSTCTLTRELTVWVNQDKATSLAPDPKDDEYGPCSVFLGEICQADAPVYADRAHKIITMKHAPGTLVRVCGEIGDDYYVEMRAWCGLIPKAAVQMYRPLDAALANDSSGGYGLPVVTRTVHTGGARLALGCSATGYSDARIVYVYDGEQVKVLRQVGGWEQLQNGAFIESRFLDPAGDHSIRYATVRSSDPLSRLNIRYSADGDSESTVKLFSGTQVQVASHTEEWASVFLSSGVEESAIISGSAMLAYLAFEGEEVPDARPRVRLTATLKGSYGYSYGEDDRNYRGRTELAAGTELTVLGVDVGYVQGSVDRYLCQTDRGRIIFVEDRSGVLEPLNPGDFTAKVRSRVRMRTAPNGEAEMIRMLSAGKKVRVLLRGESWTMVEYGDETGYVMSKYLTFP